MRNVRHVFLVSVAAMAALVYPCGTRAQQGSPRFWALPTDAASLRKEADTTFDRARALRRQLIAVEGQRTVQNTLVPFDEILRNIGLAGAPASTLRDTHPDAAMRQAAIQVQQQAAALRSEVMLDPRVYRAISALERLDGLDAETPYYLTKVLKEFQTAGADKSDEVREQIAALKKEIVKLQQDFRSNIVDGRATLSLKPEQMEGLPADYLKAHTPDDQGNLLITNDRVDVQPVVAYANDATVRRRASIFLRNRGYPANMDTLDKLIAARRRLALLAGFPNFAAVQMESRMAGSEARQREFLNEVDQATRDAATKQMDLLLAAKRKDEPDATLVEMWDVDYYLRQIKEQRYQFDEQEARPYFPYEQVKQGLLEISTKLFGINFRPLQTTVWHPTVEAYEVLEGGKVIGRFYLDMFPRKDKYQHFSSRLLRPGVAGKHLPESILVCNFTAPTENDPALMTPAAARTFFHEFGHLLHRLFAGGQRWMRLLSPERDFTEAPSQLLEEWLRDPAVLATFARHYETGEPISARLVERMNRASKFGAAVLTRRQLFAAHVALAYESGEANLDTDALARALYEKYFGGRYPEGMHPQCSFSHLGSGGYAGAYYVYQWSLVIAKDLLTGFNRKNLLDPVPARRYRNLVLSPGGSKPAATLVEDFLGRPFNLQAYREWLQAE